MPELNAAGVRTYYTEQGDSEPVTLLHGGIVGGESWAPYLPALTQRYRVLVPDRRGHGRTPDVDGPYTYEAMAEETIAFLDQVVGSPTHLVGYSDGGNVALHVARDRPDLVRKIVTIGSNFHYQGLHPVALAMMVGLDPQSPDWAPMREHYAAISPDGDEHWPVFAAKVVEMGRTGPTMTVQDVRRIECPLLVMVGDDDIITYEHTATLFESLPQGQLAVIPGTSHLLPEEKPELVRSLILDFLSDGKPSRLAPTRFAPETG